MTPPSDSACRCSRSLPAERLNSRRRLRRRPAMLEAAISGERTLTGPEKAAALLLMMGKPPAARLLKQFDQPDLQAVARAAAGLGAIPATTLDRLVDEFATDFSAGADLFGDAGQVKSLLADSLPPEQIADILGVESGETKELDIWRGVEAGPGAAPTGFVV